MVGFILMKVFVGSTSVRVPEHDDDDRGDDGHHRPWRVTT